MKKYAILLTALAATACNSGEKITTTQQLEYTTTVIEYTPAPGQFINEPKSGYDNITTPEAACRYAAKRLATGDYVSLGGWGGYLIAKFEKPVPATAAGYELFIAGNPLANSSEPGVVFVSQDANGNGRPDDAWYELRGSEYARNTYDYSVTYHRPDTDNTPVRWTDNRGQSGTIDRMAEHTQPSYYPVWIAADEMTIRTVRLPDNISQGTVEGTGAWIANPFAWGYVDNFSAIDQARGFNRLSIADAVDDKGQPANLRQIDFVRIQTGVHAKAPQIGEISTEVCRIACLRTVQN